MELLIVTCKILLATMWLSMIWLAAMAACAYIIGFVIGVITECMEIGMRNALASTTKTTLLFAHNLGKSITCNIFGVSSTLMQHKGTRYSWVG